MHLFSRNIKFSPETSEYVPELSDSNGPERKGVWAWFRYYWKKGFNHFLTGLISSILTLGCVWVWKNIIQHPPQPAYVKIHLTGQVCEHNNTTQPVADALIYMEGKEEPIAMTDSLGRFVVEEVIPADQEQLILECQKTGYHSRKKPFDIPQEDKVPIIEHADFQLIRIVPHPVKVSVPKRMISN